MTSQGEPFVVLTEVKSGRSRLTPDEQRLQNLVGSKRVSYVVLSVKRIGMADDVTSDLGE